MCCDLPGNIVLENARERKFAPGLYCDIPVGLYLVRGESMMLIAEFVRIMLLLLAACLCSAFLLATVACWCGWHSFHMHTMSCCCRGRTRSGTEPRTRCGKAQWMMSWLPSPQRWNLSGNGLWRASSRQAMTLS